MSSLTTFVDWLDMEHRAILVQPVNGHVNGPRSPPGRKGIEMSACTCNPLRGGTWHYVDCPAAQEVEPSAPSAEIRSLTPEEHANLAAYYKGRYKKVGAASGQAGAGPSAKCPKCGEPMESTFTRVSVNSKSAVRVCCLGNDESRHEFILWKFSDFAQFFPVSAPASQPSAEQLGRRMYEHQFGDAKKWSDALEDIKCLWIDKARFALDAINSLEALSAPKAPAGQPEMRYTAREIISLIRSVEWEEEFMKADDESYIAFITGKLAQRGGEMNEKEVQETLESLEDDAGKLYGRLYEDQRIGGSATLDELLDVMGISLRILKYVRHMGTGREGL